MARSRGAHRAPPGDERARAQISLGNAADAALAACNLGGGGPVPEGVRRLLSRAVLTATAAVALAPAAAAAQPPPPGPAPAALRGTPYVVRDGTGRARLYVRLDRPLAQRFDGEFLAGAVLAGRFTALAEVAGRGRGACYTAAVRLPPGWVGPLVDVAIVVDGPPPTTLTALVALRAPRPGDARGAPLGC